MTANVAAFQSPIPGSAQRRRQVLLLVAKKESRLCREKRKVKEIMKTLQRAETGEGGIEEWIRS